MSKTQKISDQRGMIIPVILVMLAVFFIFATSIMSWALQGRKSVMTKARDTKALQVAESGINYYKWHLAHFEDDFKDGNSWCCDGDDDGVGDDELSVADCGGVCGPYTKDYIDYEGKKIGEYSIKITPPLIGSTVLGIESTGKIDEDDKVNKTVNARLGKKSLARYGLMVNGNIWVGSTSTYSGPLHSNGGIRYDGHCNAEVTSAKPTYDARSYGGSINQSGIWSPSPVAECAQNWLYPVPEIPFSLFSVDMSKIKDKSQLPAGAPEGIFLPYTGDSGYKGYQLVFNDDSTVTIDVIRITHTQVSYSSDGSNWANDLEQPGSPQRYTTPTNSTGIYPMPANGLIFVEDDAWVSGTVNGRATVAASNPSRISDNARIIINGDINYHQVDGNRDETCVLGLMAKGDILLPRHVPNGTEGTLNIDAVMLSQAGHVQRRLYSPVRKQNLLKIYGGVISYLPSGWAWYSGSTFTDGFQTRNVIYDTNLTFSPPPSFPTEGDFEVLSWSEKR